MENFTSRQCLLQLLPLNVALVNSKFLSELFPLRIVASWEYHGPCEFNGHGRRSEISFGDELLL